MKKYRINGTKVLCSCVKYMYKWILTKLNLLIHQLIWQLYYPFWSTGLFQDGNPNLQLCCVFVSPKPRRQVLRTSKMLLYSFWINEHILCGRIRLCDHQARVMLRVICTSLYLLHHSTGLRYRYIAFLAEQYLLPYSLHFCPLSYLNYIICIRQFYYTIMFLKTRIIIYCLWLTVGCDFSSNISWCWGTATLWKHIFTRFLSSLQDGCQITSHFS